MVYGQALNIRNWAQMNTDYKGSKYKELTEKIIGIFYKVYNNLGYGFWKMYMKMQ